MADKNSRWSWDVKGFEPKKTTSFQVKGNDHQSRTPSLGRRYSISDLSKHTTLSKLLKFEDKLKLAREDYAVLRQEASHLQEYSNAKLDRLSRYLGALADKTRKLDQVALEAEARITPLITEKKRLFNDLLTAKGNVKAFCRTRPLFENEGPSVVEFPDEYTVRVCNLTRGTDFCNIEFLMLY